MVRTVGLLCQQYLLYINIYLKLDHNKVFNYTFNNRFVIVYIYAYFDDEQYLMGTCKGFRNLRRKIKKNKKNFDVYITLNSNLIILNIFY